MILKDYNSKGRTKATIFSYATFYRESEEYSFEVDCPICDGDGWVYGTTRNDNDVRMDCPHCNGHGTITVYDFIDEIEEEVEIEETIVVNPYEDNSLSYSRRSASDVIRHEKDYDRMLGMLERRFSGKVEEIKKARELEKKKNEILEAYKEELMNLTKDFYMALRSDSNDSSVDEVLNTQGDLMEQIRVVNEKMKALVE